MISLCVLSVHSQPSERQKGLISDKNVLQRYLQLRTLANKRLHKVNHINGFRQSLGKLDHIYSHKDKYSILKRQARDKRDTVGFAGSDILDTLLSTLLRPGSSDQPSNFRTPFPRLSVNADFNFLRNQMQSSGWKLLTIYPKELIWYLFLYFCCCLLGANSIMLHNYIFISKGCILLFIYFIS